ncbi:MAG TPA: OmpA family protein, partial [Chitinophagales bacterium]|nr:OmpA family protein [Chitinophagales bacterium]
PDPDRDGDGIINEKDKCPDVPGTFAAQGCPDRDGDGVPDSEDKCPDVAGPASNKGCPEVKEEAKKRLAFAARAIQFETGKATIKTTSYKILDEVASILKEYPYYDVNVEGNTDNVGKPELNLKLSKERAAAAVAYLVSKGIAPARLISEGYGDTRPIGDNKTAAGRAQNRRVEFKLLFR